MMRCNKKYSDETNHVIFETFIDVPVPSSGIDWSATTNHCRHCSCSVPSLVLMPTDVSPPALPADYCSEFTFEYICSMLETVVLPFTFVAALLCLHKMSGLLLEDGGSA